MADEPADDDVTLEPLFRVGVLAVTESELEKLHLAARFLLGAVQSKAIEITLEFKGPDGILSDPDTTPFFYSIRDLPTMALAALVHSFGNHLREHGGARTTN